MTFAEFWEVMTPAQGFLLAMIIMLGVLILLLILLLIANKIQWGTWLP